jgi:hypothetical protein
MLHTGVAVSNLETQCKHTELALVGGVEGLELVVGAECSLRLGRIETRKDVGRGTNLNPGERQVVSSSSPPATSKS